MADKQIQKIHDTGNGYGDDVSGSIKITQPVRTLDVHIELTPTNDSTAPTKTALAGALGGMAMLKSIQMDGSNGYSQHLSREEILALAMMSNGSAYWNDFDTSTTSAVGTKTQLSLRIPLGLRVEYETLNIVVGLETSAGLYSANPPTAGSITVDVGFSHGPVVNEYRTWKFPNTASAEQQLTGLPNSGTLIGIFDIQDIDAETDEATYLASRNHIEVKQDDQLVTQPEAYQMLQNFLSLQKNLALQVDRPGIGYIPMDLVLTDTETIYARQGSTTDTYDIVLVVTKALNRQVPTKPYISQTIDTNETDPASDDKVIVNDGPSGGFEVGGGGFIGGGFNIPGQNINFGSNGRIQAPGVVQIKK